MCPAGRGRALSLSLVGALAVSAWSTCAYAGPLAPRTPVETTRVADADADDCTAPGPDDCCATREPADCCLLDARLETGRLVASAAPVAAPAPTPVPPAWDGLTPDIPAALGRAGPAADSVRKLPRAPIYLLVSSFLI